MASFKNAALLLALASTSHAQFGSFGGSGNPYYNGGGSDGGFPGVTGFDRGDFFSTQEVMVLAHAVMACVAFAFLFPVGGIMIRLGSFRGVWILHGIFQIFAYLLYIAAFAIGIYMALNLDLMTTPHAIIGIVLVVLLFFQPLSGFMHHTGYKRTGGRTGPSYAHIWLGRIVITAGIVNGGLGLQLAQTLPFARPSMSAIIGYAVGAGVIWLIYVVAAIIGEARRGRGSSTSSRSDTTSSSYTSSRSHASSRSYHSRREEKA